MGQHLAEGFSAGTKSCRSQGENRAVACARFRPLVDEGSNCVCRLGRIARIYVLENVTLERCHSSSSMVQWQVMCIDLVCSVVCDAGLLWGGCKKAVNGAEERIDAPGWWMFGLLNIFFAKWLLKRAFSYAFAKRISGKPLSNALGNIAMTCTNCQFCLGSTPQSCNCPFQMCLVVLLLKS